jgi:hypothetical protein
MIYFLYGEYAVRACGLPEIGCAAKAPGPEYRFMDLAEASFSFHGNKTFYWKNRYGEVPGGYQYTDEERLILKLKAVPL